MTLSWVVATCCAYPGRRYEFGLKWGVDIVTPAWCRDTAKVGGRVDTRRYKLPLDISGKPSPMESELAIPELPEEEFYMDGYRIFLVGLVGERGRLYVNIVRAAGATIPSTMDGRVTHVVVATPPSEEQLAEWRQVAPVMHAEWLLACCQQRKLVNHTHFELLPQDDGPAPTQALASSAALPPAFVPRPSGTLAAQADSSSPPATREVVADVGAVNLDFTSMFTGSWNDGAPTAAAATGVKPKASSNASFSQASAGAAPSAPEEGADPRTVVFKDLTFALHTVGFDERKQHDLTAVLTKVGGSLSPLAAADYVVWPLAAPSPSKSAGDRAVTSATRVTECWIERCITDGELVAPESCAVFQPLPVSNRGRDSTASAAAEVCVPAGLTLPQPDLCR